MQFNALIDYLCHSIQICACAVKIGVFLLEGCGKWVIFSSSGTIMPPPPHDTEITQI